VQCHRECIMNNKYKVVRFMSKARPPRSSATVYTGESILAAHNYLIRDMQMRLHDKNPHTGKQVKYIWLVRMYQNRLRGYKTIHKRKSN